MISFISEGCEMTASGDAALKRRSCRKGRYAPPVHLIKLDRDARDHALRLGASGRGEVSPPVQTGRVFVVLARI
jgi:hypothetical protein